MKDEDRVNLVISVHNDYFKRTCEECPLDGLEPCGDMITYDDILINRIFLSNKKYILKQYMDKLNISFDFRTKLL